MRSYRPRTLEETVRQASDSFPVLLLTGPRQIGKTTLLEHCTGKERRYVTLDDPALRALANTDPELFLQKYHPPLIIDEVQYAPRLFSYIKILCDRLRQPGLFWLTGSQRFHLMRGITESLAGRVAIIDMLGLSQAEIFGRAASVKPFLPTSDWMAHVHKENLEGMTASEVYRRIWLGSFPKIALDSTADRELFYTSYIQTYIQRDVRELVNIAHEEGFYRFVQAVAARTGQLLNYAELARDVDINHRTVKAWLEVLEASGLIYLLRPYHNNLTNRLLKTPKLYFLDTGLCTFLTRWQSPEALEAGAMAGAIFETYAFTEILKSYWHNGKGAYFNFYRDKDFKEIDLLIEADNVLYPIEFKKTATPTQEAAKHFNVLQNLKRRIGHGAVICLKGTDIPLSRTVDAVPLGYL